MAAQYSETRNYPGECQAIINQLGSPYFSSSQQLTYTGAIPIYNGCTLSYRRSMNLLSWGEKINISVVAIGPNSSQITVHSECDMPTQIIDWGQNKKNVMSIFSHIEMQLLPSLAPAQVYQCPNCHNMINGPVPHCPYCGCQI